MSVKNDTKKEIPEKNNQDKSISKKRKPKAKALNEYYIDTSNFTIEERLVAAVWVHERKLENTSISQIKINFRMRFGKPPPTKNTLYFWEKKIFATGRVGDGKRSGRPPIRMEHIASVEESLKRDPGLSLRARAEQLSLPRTTLKKIMKDDLCISENNIQTNEAVNPNPTNSKPPDIPRHPAKQSASQPSSHFSFNIVPAPSNYPYQENIGSSAFQHYLAYPNNQNLIEGTPIITQSKIPVNSQNQIPNINNAQHVPNQQLHIQQINHQNYLHNNQDTNRSHIPNGNHNHMRSQVPSTFNSIYTGWAKSQHRC